MELYNDDCLKIMPQITDKSIDMILCDLPYGVTHNKWDSVIPFDKLWEQYNRIIKDNGAICLFADGMFMADLMESNRKMWRYNLVWDKVLSSGFLNAKRMPLRSTEEIVAFYKKLPTYNPQFTEGKPLHGMGTKYKEGNRKNNNYGNFNSTNRASAERAGDTKKYPKSLVTFQRAHSSVMLHPTEKPVALMEWLISTYTNKGETILDNCMGVGGSGIAAKNLERNYIGIELDQKYFEIAKERIEVS